MSDKLRAREVFISHEPIELYKVLKFEGLVNSGGEAKVVISAGSVRVNGTIETRKRRKISDGDTIEFAGEALRIRLQQRKQE
ncbi:MAG: RNA-binding S4 domain-containing protein [Pseudomonadota bacterium]